MDINNIFETYINNMIEEKKIYKSKKINNTPEIVNYIYPKKNIKRVKWSKYIDVYYY
jgi:hypothetical protein